MTQITGKIYQMKNAAGTENRFPRTVIEAVLGLSSYLQQQFGALADIYMPIGGIQEALDGQEFVYRESPNTIKAKSLTLDRILGRTHAFNQIVQNGNFAEGGVRWGAGSGGVLSVSNGVATVTETATGTATYATLSQGVNYVNGHKYLVLAYVKSNNSGSTVRAGIGSSSSGATTQYTYYPEWTRLTLIGEYNTEVSGNMVIEFRPYNSLDPNQDVSISFKNVMCVDLTLLYGSEIDGLTDEQILAKYDADFPDSYYDYNEGTLISNDASEIETVGRNVWDEEAELGSLNSNGQPISSSSAIRAKNYIPAFGNTEYKITCLSGTSAQFVTYFYDANKNMIPYTGTGAYQNGYNSSTGLFTSPSGTAFMRFRSTNDYGTTYNHDICINLSDTNFNGQYEPYRKSTLHLGLNSFRVKDSQGNIITITGGLKSAGDAYDEIVGNKYIKRIGEVDLGTLSFTYKSTEERFHASLPSVKLQGSLICPRYKKALASEIAGKLVDKAVAISGTSAVLFVRDTDFTDAATFKTAMSGVMLYYELATEEVYDLVEPIVPTVKAGTTEARVSPNVNGLSAPFRSDITYSASENNDAAYSQYAATAGRLLNAQTIWGQTFDGSSPVSGALTGVTNLTASGVLSGSRLVSTVAQGTAPLTVTSDTMVVNLNANYLGGVALGNLLTDFTSPAGDSPQSSITVGGRTEYARINADTLDGQHGSYYAPLQDLQTVAGRVTSLENWFLSPELAELTVTQLNVTNEINGNAKTATKLKTTRTIWGQNFNGSANVTGALSSVTNINSLIYLSNGYVGIGVSAPSHALDVSGDGHFNGKVYWGTAYIEYNSTASALHANSGLYCDSYITAGASASSSDARLKDNITAVSEERALSILSSLRGAEWDWNDKKSALAGQHGSGLVAQEVQKVMPWAVLDVNGELALNYNSLWGVIIPVIQSMKSRIEELESKLSNR